MPKATSSKIINGTPGNDTLFGDPSMFGNGQNQTINGLAGDDTLYGDASFITGKANGGNDTLNGGDGKQSGHYAVKHSWLCSAVDVRFLMQNDIQQ